MNRNNSTHPSDKVVAGAAVAVALAFAGWTATRMSLTPGPEALFVIIIRGAFFLVWIAMPYLILAAATIFVSRGWISLVIIGLSVLALGFYGVAAFRDVSKDAQGGLAFLFVPLWQCGMAFVACVLAGGIEVGRSRLNKRTGDIQNIH